jgi:hypothetical protein
MASVSSRTRGSVTKDTRLSRAKLTRNKNNTIQKLDNRKMTGKKQITRKKPSTAKSKVKSKLKPKFKSQNKMLLGK